MKRTLGRIRGSVPPKLPAPFVEKVFTPLEMSPEVGAFAEEMARHRVGSRLDVQVSGPVPGPHADARDFAVHYLSSLVCKGHVKGLKDWPCTSCLAKIGGKVDHLLTSHQQGSHEKECKEPDENRGVGTSRKPKRNSKEAGRSATKAPRR